MNLSILVALTEKGVIGKDNSLPWSLPKDLKRFKALTMGKAIVMGRKTYDSIGRPLPGRRNIVISRNKDFKKDGIDVYSSIPDALSSCASQDEVFIIGGAQIFRETLPLVNKLYLTWIYKDFPGDVIFPNFENFLEPFEKISSQIEDEAFSYEFADYLRKKS